jgi:hypothetical protein
MSRRANLRSRPVPKKDGSYRSIVGLRNSPFLYTGAQSIRFRLSSQLHWIGILQQHTIELCKVFSLFGSHD